MNKQLKKSILKSCLIVSVAILIVLASFFVRADEVQPASMVTQQVSQDQYLINPEQYYYPSLNNPSNFMTWSTDYCNQTQDMDFIVEVLPNACEPNPVTSDLLEEQPVPVLCKLTGIKINPLIDVPSIKNVVPTFKNQSPEIAYINFYPAKSALGSYQFNTPNAIVTEGNPTLSNLGYVVVSLKQQPIESKMPNNVSVNVLLNITYDVAKTYGLNTQQFVLPLMTQQEWQNSYKKYSFWNGKGYVRLQEIKDQSAKISVYYNALGNPINPTKEIREGDSIQVKLPGFYCQEGVNVTLDKIEIPTTKARLMVNGDEFILEKGEDVADSNCQVSDIQPDQYGYGGSVSISCNGAVGSSAYTLDLAPRHAQVKITDRDGEREEDITVGKEIRMNVSYGDKYRYEYYYVAHVGKLAVAGSTPVDTVVIFAGKGRTKLSDTDKKTLISAFQDYISNVHTPTELGSGTIMKHELNSKSQVNNKLDFVLVIGKDIEPFFGGQHEDSGSIKVESVEGPRQVTYSADIEKAYKDALNQYRSIANQFSKQKDSSGIYYGIKSLRQAASLAEYMLKESDELTLLQEIVDKYQDDQEEDIQAEVDSARDDILSLSRGSGNKSVIINSDKGTYYTTLLSIEKPGYNSQEAHIKINGTEGAYIVGDSIDKIIIQDITDTGVKFLSPETDNDNMEQVIANGGTRYLLKGTTKVEVMSTLVRKEAKVTVWPLERERTTSTNFSVVIGIEKRSIQLTPEQIQKRIQELNKTIDTLDKYVSALEKLNTAWNKACYIGGSILWAKNLIGGLTGESLARGIVMKAWTIKCASEQYRSWLGSNRLITVSQCYKKNQTEIKNDVTAITSLVNEANSFVGQVKSKSGVMISGGFLGMSKQIDDDKFILESKALFLSKYSSLINDVHVDIEVGRISREQKNRLVLLKEITENSSQVCGTTKTVSEVLQINEASPEYTKTIKSCQIQVPVDVENVINSLDKVANQGKVSVDDIKDIYLILAINQKSGISETLKAYNDLKSSPNLMLWIRLPKMRTQSPSLKVNSETIVLIILEIPRRFFQSLQ